MFNLFKKTENIPEWFSSNSEDYNYFIKIVESVRKEKIPEYFFSSDKSALVLMQDQDESLRVNLFNVAQICLQSPKNEWKNIVTGFLDSLGDESFNDKDNFEDIKSTIVVQLYPKEILQQTEIPFLYREIIPETLAILAFDTPKKIEFLKPETIEIWKKNLDELFALALKNTKDILQKLSFEPVTDDSSIHMCESDNVLTACGTLFLQDICKQYNEKGIIFSCPNRHTIIALEIKNLDAVTKEISLLGGFTQEVFLSSPYGVNSHIYWLKEGVYMKLQYEIVDNNFNFYPPQEFLDLFE